MNRKKLLITVLMISFLVSSLAIVTSDDSDASTGTTFNSSDYYFKYTVQTEDISTSTGTVSVSRFSTLYNTVTIPSTVVNNGITYDVIAINADGFKNSTGITSVIIGSKIISIGDSAFSGCSKLTSVTIPTGVQSIGNYAFNNCYKLTSVTIPTGVQSIGNYAFYYCYNLTTVSIPSGVTSIGDHAFDYCTGLTTVSIPSGVTSIGNYAFYYCYNLTTVSIPSSVIYIGDHAFDYCTGLITINTPSGVTYIGDYAFNNCKKLTSFTFTSSLTHIGDYAFGYCKGLTSLDIPSGSIESNAFQSCTGLLHLTIGSNVTYVKSSAFNGCSSLIDVYICNGVISIGNYAFQYCTSLKTVILPTSVTSIGDSAFYYCTALKSISVPSSNISIGKTVFGRCSSFSSILYNEDSTMLIYCPTSKSGSFEIPSTVKTIASGAFYCGNLTSITIPSSVTSIGSSTFYSCSKLTSITIPSGVTSIEDYTFQLCSNLTSITIPSSVTSIGTCAFYDCSKLTAVTIPSNVTSIGSGAFSGCSELISVMFFSQPSNIEDYSFDVNTNNKCTIWSTGLANSTIFNSDVTENGILNFGLLYTVTFDSNGGSSVPNQLICENTCATLPSSTMTGYSLSGWFTDLSSSPYNFNDPITSNLTLYAMWTANKYTVTTSEGTGTTIDLSGTDAQYGNDYSFTVNSNTGYDHSTPLVTVLIGSTTYTNLTNVDNVYTIHATDIVNEITIITYDLSPNLYSVSGTLTISNGLSPVGISVVLTSGSDTYTAITDSEGKYILNNVPYGTSGNIVTYVEHYHQNAVLSISVSGDAFNENITLDLDSYIVTWENYNGTILKTDSVDYGNIPVYSGSTPQKNATSSYYYEFSGWSPTISAVTGDITYTATFDSTLRSYTVSIASSTYGLFSGAGIYQVGDTVTIDFTTGSQHYVIEQWNVDGAMVLSQTSNSLTFTMPASDTTVSYTIIKDPSVKECEISYINPSSVSINPNPNTLDEGTVESFTVESTTDYTSLTITVRDSTNTIIYQGTFTDTDADGVITGTFTITVTDNITIELLSNTPTNSDIDLSNNVVRIMLILFIIFLIFLGYIIYRKYVRPRLIEKRDKQDDDQSP